MIIIVLEDKRRQDKEAQKKVDLAREARERRRADEQKRRARGERFQRQAVERKMRHMAEENLVLRRRLDEMSAR